MGFCLSVIIMVQVVVQVFHDMEGQWLKPLSCILIEVSVHKILSLVHPLVCFLFLKILHPCWLNVGGARLCVK